MLPKKRGTGDEAVVSCIQEGNFKLYINVAKIVLTVITPCIIWFR